MKHAAQKPGQQGAGAVLMKHKKGKSEDRAKRCLVAVKVELEPASVECLFFTSVGLAGERTPFPIILGEREAGQTVPLVNA